MFLILGLGNPGPRYEVTRHNIGFLVADYLADKFKISLEHHRYSAVGGRGEIGEFPVMVAKPTTYMNNSGKSAKALVAGLNIFPEQLIVVHDDIDLPLGKIKKKHRGGDAGQLGVRSIIERLGTDQFTRIRMGVGRPDDREDIVDYVLSPFEDEELPVLNTAIEQAVRMVEETLVELKKTTNQTEEQKGC